MQARDFPSIRLVLWCAIATNSARGQVYSVRDLDLKGNDGDVGLNTVSALNDNGQVVGFGPIDGVQSEDFVPFIWENGQIAYLLDLKNKATDVTGVNNCGQVIGTLGYTQIGPHSEMPAFIWNNGSITKIGGARLEFVRSPQAINDFGQVVGYVLYYDFQGSPFIWESGIARNLPTLGAGGEATDINCHGEIVGNSCEPNHNGCYPVLWKSGEIISLGSFGGSSNNEAHAMNECGTVLGRSSFPDESTIHAFLWKDGVMSDLGTFGGDTSSAQAINSAGRVVGSSTTTETLSAFLWHNGKMTDLNTLIPADFQFHLDNAIDINESGQILASGWKSGQLRYFLLTPELAINASQQECACSIDSSKSCQIHTRICGNGLFPFSLFGVLTLFVLRIAARSD